MAETMEFLPRKDLLTLEELDRLCSAFVARGTTKLRLTGGEPLMRRDIMSLFRALSRHLASGALKELTLTTSAARNLPDTLRNSPIAGCGASTSRSIRSTRKNSGN